jgi:hypothetical protein
MLKKDYKAHVAANQFDLNSLPVCGGRTRSGGLCKHRGTFVMVDVNATAGLLQALLTSPLERTIIGMFMALELKKSSL